MPLGNGLVYLVFHPLVYLLKLHIELNLTDLLAKIVRVAEGHSTHSEDSKGRTGKSGTGTHTGGTRMATLITANRDRDHPEAEDIGKGIQKTVETEIRYTKDESDAASGTGSTNQLFEQSPY